MKNLYVVLNAKSGIIFAEMFECQLLPVRLKTRLPVSIYITVLRPYNTHGSSMF